MAVIAAVVVVGINLAAFQVPADIDQPKMSKKILMSQVRMSFTYDGSPSDDREPQPTMQLTMQQQSARRHCQKWKHHSRSAKVSAPIEMHILVGLMYHEASDQVKRWPPSATRSII